MTLRLNSLRFYFSLWFHLLPIASFAIARYICFNQTWRSGNNWDPQFYFVVLFVTMLIWSLVSEHYQLNSTDELFRENTGIIKTCCSVGVTYALVALLLFFYRQQSFSRLFLVVSATGLLIIILLSRALLRSLLKGYYSARYRLRVLIVGADAHAREFGRQLSEVPIVAPWVVGYVRLPGQHVEVEGATVLEMDDVRGGMCRVPFDEVIISTPPTGSGDVAQIVRELAPLRTPIRTAVDLGGVQIARERVFRVGPLHLVDLASTPLESPAYFVLKRTFDVTFSLAALLLTSPLMLVIAIAVKLSSPGPILFRQQRIGLNGHPFVMYKFRTMRESDPEESDCRWTSSDDERRTRIGSILRKTSLDELPQFFNVIKGEMSVVGPRPERPYFVGQFQERISHYGSRHRLKVGITGWAQVNGWRGDTSIEKRFEFDSYYLQNWSFWFDMRILALTVLKGLIATNAY